MQPTGHVQYVDFQSGKTLCFYGSLEHNVTSSLVKPDRQRAAYINLNPGSMNPHLNQV